MGITIHWQRQEQYDAETFADARFEFQGITNDIARGKDRLFSMAGPDGSPDSDPILNDEQIVFNGLAPQSCEPFIFNRTQQPRPGRDYVSSFCKTGNLPYTIGVQCALLVLKKYFGNQITIYSDSTISQESWEKALSACRSSTDNTRFEGGYEKLKLSNPEITE